MQEPFFYLYFERVVLSSQKFSQTIDKVNFWSKTMFKKFSIQGFANTLIKVQTQGFHQKAARLNHNFIKATSLDANINMIVLHGMLGSANNFKSILKNQKISQYANAYLLDLRNHGQSEHKPTMTDQEMALDIYEFIKSNDLEEGNVVVLGHSMGARVAMAFSALYSEIPKGVIIVDYAPHNYANDPKFSIIKKTKEMIDELLLVDMNRDFDDVKKDIYRIAYNKDVAGLLLTNIDRVGSVCKWRPNLQAIAESYMNISSAEWKRKQKYGGPVKIICGAESDYVSPEVTLKFSDVFSKFDPKRDLKYIEGAGHWVHFQKPYEFIEEVSGFLKKVATTI